MSEESVNNPAHYTGGNIECIDAIVEALGVEGAIAFCRGNVMKYAWRAGKKGCAKEDMEKAAWYAKKAAELEQLDTEKLIAFLKDQSGKIELMQVPPPPPKRPLY